MQPNKVEIECQHCGVHIGETPAKLHAMYHFCPYCGEQIMPHVVGVEHES